MIPTVKQLQYLVALSEELHFGRAAQACHVTQPALSDQLRIMEEGLGVQLVERSRRRVLMTPTGRLMAERARGILRELETLADLARGARGPFARPIRLGVIPTVAPYLLPALLAPLHKRLPELRLYLREEKTPDLIEQLAGGRLDAGLLALPLEDPAPFAQRVLYTEEFQLLVPEGHRLAGRGRVGMDDLAGQALLLLEEGHCLRDQALEVCRLSGARDSPNFRATSLGTLVQMVVGGMGITLLPQMAVRAELRGGGELRALPFEPPAPHRTIGLVWRRGAGREDEFRELARQIVELLPPGARPECGD